MHGTLPSVVVRLAEPGETATPERNKILAIQSIRFVVVGNCLVELPKSGRSGTF